MPGSSADAAEIRAAKRVVIVEVIVGFGDAVVLFAGANHTQDLSARVGVCWEKGFVRAGRIICRLHGTIRIEARNMRAKRCHIRKPDC